MSCIFSEPLHAHGDQTQGLGHCYQKKALLLSLHCHGHRRSTNLDTLLGPLHRQVVVVNLEETVVLDTV